MRVQGVRIKIQALRVYGFRVAEKSGLASSLTYGGPFFRVQFSNGFCCSLLGLKRFRVSGSEFRAYDLGLRVDVPYGSVLYSMATITHLQKRSNSHG